MQSAFPAVEIIRPKGQGPVVLVCEHASRAMPPAYGSLGLDEAAMRSHAAWDIGAMEVAVALSAMLDAPLVMGGVSRLIYDLNRPPEAASAIPDRSEIFDIPGNRNLSDQDRAARAAAIHDPFHNALSDLLDQRAPTALVTIHSFTPVYNGVAREVEIGFLHDADGTLAKAALAAEEARGTYRAALNEPYTAADGVTYTLAKHGEARGLPALMIEVRNDLIDTSDTAEAMAAHLKDTLEAAMTQIGGPA